MDGDGATGVRLPEVSVDTEAALARALRRGGRRRRVRRAAFGAALGVCVVAAGVAVLDAREETDLDVVGAPPTSSSVSTAPVPTEPVGGDPATWTVDPSDPPSAEASTFTARVTRLGCAGGETGEVLAPEIVEAGSEIGVRFSVEHIDGSHTCPANRAEPYVVDLGEPLGDRALVDLACAGEGSAGSGGACAGGATRWPTMTTSTTSTTSTQPAVDPQAGGLESASMAIRRACRRFYGYDSALDDPTGTTLITEEQAVGRCDRPAIEFKDDCYAPRPAEFVTRIGGCADLGGYLAVYHRVPPDGVAVEEIHRFQVGADVWWIYPESD